MNRRTLSITVFAIGIAAMFLALRFSETRQIFTALERAGYAGAFVAGIFYGLSFTAPSATVIFAQHPSTLHPLVLAIMGGLGALSYDISIFSLFRRSREQTTEFIRSKIRTKRQLPTWLLIILGIVIIASPLPDELAAGFLGLSTMKVWQFLLLSFVLNTLGIFVIVALGR